MVPDMVVDGKVVVEFYGDYFHANPKMHTADEYIVKKGKTAKELWEADAQRKKLLEDAGFVVLVVWQNEFRSNRTKCLNVLVDKIDSIIQGEKNAVDQKRK